MVGIAWQWHANGDYEQGHRDGEGTVPEFNCPSGIAVDGNNNIIVADEANHRIRNITLQGHVSTLVGTGEKGHRDGKGTVTQLYSPSGLVLDGDNNVIVADCRTIVFA
jgi:hypothetical protein